MFIEFPVFKGHAVLINKVKFNPECFKVSFNGEGKVLSRSVFGNFCRVTSAEVNFSKSE